MQNPSRVVIVGAGQAGAAAAVALRDEGFEGSVTLIGAEPYPPYERPPLSKTYLRGETVREDAQLQDREFWTGRGIDLRTGVAVERIDLAGGSLELARGATLDYDRLVLATGSAPRSLPVPGSGLEGVLALRTLEDADRIRRRAQEASRVLVVGGGWIGSEITASLRQMGIPVTLALSGDLPLQGALGRTLAEVYDGLHREHGAEVIPRSRVTAFEGDGSVRAARTAAGERIEADLVVTAVGARPRLELARSAGLTVSDGIVVDGLLRTDTPAVLAAGDVAEAPYPDLGRSMRFEHWAAAQSQGSHVARTIMGHREPYAELPYFFSDQYDTGMEFWGDPDLPGEVVVRGDLSARSFTAFWVQDQRVRAALNMHVHHHRHADDHDEAAAQPDGDPGAAAAGGHAGGHVDSAAVARLLRSTTPVDPRALRDPGVPVAELASAAG